MSSLAEQVASLQDLIASQGLRAESRGEEPLDAFGSHRRGLDIFGKVPQDVPGGSLLAEAGLPPARNMALRPLGGRRRVQ